VIEQSRRALRSEDLEHCERNFLARWRVESRDTAGEEVCRETARSLVADQDTGQELWKLGATTSDLARVATDITN
jgi:hypothetical protein